MCTKISNILNTINITLKAKQLIQLESKTWLSEQLGITRNTLDSRLEKENWKLLEEQKIIKLSR